MPDVLRESASKYASRFSDPEDAMFMVQNAGEQLHNLFEQRKAEPAPLRSLPSPASELQARIEQGRSTNPGRRDAGCR